MREQLDCNPRPSRTAPSRWPRRARPRSTRESTQAPLLYLSTDGGITWNPAATGLPNSSDLQAVFLNPTNNGSAFVTFGAYADAFVTKVNASATGLIYSTSCWDRAET